MADYEFVQTGVSESKIKEYSLLLSSVFDKSNKYSTEFLQWQYALNPNGHVVGFDAYADGVLVAHYVTVPVVYVVDGITTKGLLSLNTATHPQHQGKGLFTQLANRTYELGKTLGYKFIIGVANQNSTHGFLKKLGFYLISPLDVKIGLGNIVVNNTSNYKIKALWNTESVAWRLKCPGANYFYNGTTIYSATDKPFIFSKITEAPKTIAVNQLKKKALLPIKLWIGVAKEVKQKGFFLNLPDKLKPSPLNLIFKDLSDTMPVLKKEDIYFELIDFDAY
jgi:GNAT superfamily N-acetyltransferase